MISSKAIKLIGSTTFVLCPSIINGAPFVISDDRVRSLDITPVLGRGYSIGSNSFQSNCLMVDETTTPSYNYDFTFSDFSGTTNLMADVAAKLSTTFGYEGIKNEAKVDDVGSENSIRMVVTTMRIDRYYSSVREEISPLSPAALILLDNQDYIGFFKSCGPAYVRSIRRAQEITAIFKFEAVSATAATDFAAALKKTSTQVTKSSEESSITAESQYAAISSSLMIKILGFGLGLNVQGLNTLVSTNIQEFNEVMKFAFNAFTTTEDTQYIGMVYGIEIVPWVDNTEFQVASKLSDANVVIPLGRSLIPKAQKKNSQVTTIFRNTVVDRPNYTCKSQFNFMDKYGYCCDESVLFNQASYAYEVEAGNITGNHEIYVSERICKPVRVLDKSLVKNNMSQNGEFVARLDGILRARMNTMFTLEQCVSRLNGYPSKLDTNVLKAQDSTAFESNLDLVYSVKKLKLALDPLQDYGLIKNLGKEMDEYVEMYYSPCIASLFGTNVGISSDVEPQYFMAYGWMSHPSCNRLTCLADNMRWDRDEEGCIGSVMAGSSSPNYSDDNTKGEYCVKDEEIYSDDSEEVCKIESADLIAFQTSAKACWGADINPATLLDQYCMPQITSIVIDSDEELNMDVMVTRCTHERETYYGLV